MTIATPPTYNAGTTVRFWVMDLKKLGTDADWYCDMNVPDDPGPYLIKVTITVDAVVWKGSDRFDVSAF